MTHNLKIKAILLIVTSLVLLVACNHNDDGAEKEVDINALCDTPTFLLDLTESIPATVKVVKEGQPFFNGVKRYYEVDAEAHLPSFFETNNQKIVRIFPLKDKGERIGEQIQISGRLISCVTGAHGLLTNNYVVFTLIDDN